jgi:post-segregation antitoxin (ccd killing protein)
MGKTVVTSIRIDEDVLREAKALGLNVSKVCENALKMAIERLRPLYGRDDCESEGVAGGPAGIRTRDLRLRRLAPL